MMEIKYQTWSITCSVRVCLHVHFLSYLPIDSALLNILGTRRIQLHTVLSEVDFPNTNPQFVKFIFFTILYRNQKWQLVTLYLQVIVVYSKIQIVIWLDPHALMIGIKPLVSYKVICFTTRDQTLVIL